MGEVKQMFYSDPQVDILESTAQRNLFHSGVGSGKSHVMGPLTMDFILNNPQMRGFIGANSYSQLTKSTLDKIFKVWSKDFGLRRDKHYVVDRIPPDNFKINGERLKSYENTISFNNGALIFTASLDNYKMIDGTEFGWAMLDETKDTKEEAVKEVIVARLRQIGMYINNKGVMWMHNDRKPPEDGTWKGYNPLYIFTSPAKSKWLMKWFDLDKYAEDIEKVIYDKNNYFRHYDKKKSQLVVISSTYHNEHNLSEGFIDRLIADFGGNENLVRMLVYGSPFAKMGGEFYSAYSRLKHVKRLEPWPNTAIHLAFDFNLVPYITCTCWQIKMMPETKRWRVRCFREFCLPNPKNNAESLSKEIRNTIPQLLKSGVFIYGDYSGKTKDTINEDIRTEYDMIEKILAQYLTNNSNRVTRNALHTRRRDFANKLLNGGFNVDIEIDDRCVELVSDLEFVRENPEGGKLKERVKIKGQSLEEHGHTSDSMDYFYCSAFENLFNP